VQGRKEDEGSRSKSLVTHAEGETEPESVSKASDTDLRHALEAHITGSCLLYLSLKFMCFQLSFSIIISC